MKNNTRADILRSAKENESCSHFSFFFVEVFRPTLDSFHPCRFVTLWSYFVITLLMV